MVIIIESPMMFKGILERRTFEDAKIEPLRAARASAILLVPPNENPEPPSGVRSE